MELTMTQTVSAPLVSPGVLTVELPPSIRSVETVAAARHDIEQIVNGNDSRFLVIVGPCSIHDPDAALEYARRLNNLRERMKDKICIVMRVYFEKPRSAIGWKGLINDPFMDGTYDMAAGLRLARKTLLAITDMGLAAGMELLDPIVSHYVGDLVSWAAIGARTTESQVHRQMASGLAMPVGFKNSTDGDLLVALNAIVAARNPHSFLSVDRHGRVCIARTKGNSFGHLILRGDKRGPNYDNKIIETVTGLLREHALQESIIVDCSHMNSVKRHENQASVLRDVLGSRLQNHKQIVGVMIESNLHEGRQEIPSNRGDLRYGVSVTDECMGWETTEMLLQETYEKL